MDKCPYPYIAEDHSNFLGGFGDWVHDMLTVSPEEKAAREARRKARQDRRQAEGQVQEIITQKKQVDYKGSIQGVCQRLGIRSINKPSAGLASEYTEFILKVPLKPDVREGDVLYLLSSDPHYTGLFYIAKVSNDALGNRVVVTLNVPYQEPDVNFQGGFATVGCVETDTAIETEGALKRMPDIEVYFKQKQATRNWVVGAGVVLALGIVTFAGIKIAKASKRSQ